jgi:hypothetical protein
MSRPFDDDPLTGEVRAVASLSASDEDELFQLLCTHCENVDRQRFHSDLGEKHWILLGRGAQSRALRGFCTLRQDDLTIGDRQVRIVVTGDTLLAPEDWASGLAVRMWWQQMLTMAQGARETQAYWVSYLESDRVYRLLNALFHEFFPRPRAIMPDVIRQIRNRVAFAKFGDNFDNLSGLVRPAQPTPVRAERLSIATAHGSDPATRFFVSANPGYLRGEYLVCIAELTPANFTKLGLRLSATADFNPLVA